MKFLINDTDTLRKYVGNIAATLDFGQIEGEIRSATLEFIVPYIGWGLHERMAGLAGTPSAEDGSPASVLLEKLQAALANYAALKYTPVSDTFFTAMGLQTMKSDTQVGAFAYQKTDRMNKYASDADTLMDDALTYLEAHAGQFPEWGQAEKNRHWAFASASVFSRYYGIGSSRRTFMRLLPVIERVEILELVPALGSERYRALRARGFGAPDESAYTDSELDAWMELARPALANLAISRAVYELNFRPVADTLQVASFFSSKGGLDPDRISERAFRDGQAFLARLVVSSDGNVGWFLDFSNRKGSKHFIV